MSLKVRQFGTSQSIQGEIQNFCLYLSEFEQNVKNAAKNYVIDLCSISLNGSSPQEDQLHISIVTSNIKVSVSPCK